MATTEKNTVTIDGVKYNYAEAMSDPALKQRYEWLSGAGDNIGILEKNLMEAKQRIGTGSYTQETIDSITKQLEAEKARAAQYLTRPGSSPVSEGDVSISAIKNYGDVGIGMTDPRNITASTPTSADQVKTIGGINYGSTDFGLGDFSSAMAGTSGIESYIKVQEQMAKDRQAQIQKQLDALNTSTKPLLDKLLGSKSPTDARKEAWEQTGMSPESYFADQKAKIEEIGSLKTSYEQTKATMEAEQMQAVDKLATTGYISRQQAATERKYAPTLNRMSAEINSKAATLQALQGNFNEAQNFVNQAVNDATAEYKYNYDMYQMFYDMNKDAISALDAPYQQAYEAALGLAKTEYEQAQADKRAVGELLLKYNTIGAGITMQDSLASAQQKAANVGGDITIYERQQASQYKYTASGQGGTGSGTNNDINAYANAYYNGEIELSDIPSALRGQVLSASETIDQQQNAPVAPTPVPGIQYKVQAGNTLSSLASKFGVTTQQILSANPEITNPNLIKVGQTIKIPQPVQQQKQNSWIDNIANFFAGSILGE